MPRRIEIELTSARPDGTWTWRAAGAREPKGVLDGALLYEGARTGEVLKAEADFELEGIVIRSVQPPRRDNRPQPERLEIIGPRRPEGPGVTTQLVGRERRGGDRRDRGDGPRRSDRPAGNRNSPASPRTGQDAAGPRRERRPAPARGRGGTGSDPRGSSDDRRSVRGERSGAGQGGRPGGDRRERRPVAPTHSSSASERNRPRRFSPGNAHRKAVLDSLPPEQLPVAEQLLHGGIPAVRTALHIEREKAEAEGRPAPSTEQLLAIAETLLPKLRSAEWHDRADAALADVENISLKDLRSVVAGADVARDDETRALGSQLREALERRVSKLHSDWAADIAAQLDAGKVVRAVRLSSRPPDLSAKLDPALASRLSEAAGATLGPATSADLWISLMEALAESPIRRSVTPAGLPEDASPELKKAAHQYSGSIPALARMLGVVIPPPPPPAANRQRRRPDAPPRRRPDGPRPAVSSASPSPEGATEEATNTVSSPPMADSTVEPAPAPATLALEGTDPAPVAATAGDTPSEPVSLEPEAPAASSEGDSAQAATDEALSNNE